MLNHGMLAFPKNMVVGNAASVAVRFALSKTALYHCPDRMNWFTMVEPNVCVSFNWPCHCGWVLVILKSGLIGSVSDA